VKDEMRFVDTPETRTDPLGDLVRRQQAGGLDNPPLAMHPFRLDRIEPRTLRWQRTDDDPHPCLPALDRPVVLPDPSPHGRADMPARIVPHQQQRRFPFCGQSVAAPVEELRRDRTDRTTVHEAQPQLLVALPDSIPLSHQQAVTGERLRIGIAMSDRLLDQAQWLIRLRPTRQMRSRDPTPPDLVCEAERPVGMRHCQADQAIASPFFRRYAGSGEVIHPFARCQRMPNRLSVTRIVSPVTRSAVIPCAAQTSASRSSVQTLVG